MKRFSRRKLQRKQKTRKHRGGKRLAGNVNPHMYADEYQMLMHKMGEMRDEQVELPRFLKFKEIVKYLLNSEEVIKNKSLRRVARAKINELYALNKDYINNDNEYAQQVQDLIHKLNDLDARNVRHEIPN